MTLQPPTSPYVIQLNTKTAPFNDAKAREAIYRATDFDAIDEGLFKGAYPVSQTSPPPAACSTTQTVAGYRSLRPGQGQGSSSHELGGLTVELGTLSNYVAKQINTALQTQWQEAGIEVDDRGLPAVDPDPAVQRRQVAGDAADRGRLGPGRRRGRRLPLPVRPRRSAASATPRSTSCSARPRADASTRPSGTTLYLQAGRAHQRATPTRRSGWPSRRPTSRSQGVHGPGLTTKIPAVVVNTGSSGTRSGGSSDGCRPPAGPGQPGPAGLRARRLAGSPALRLIGQAAADGDPDHARRQHPHLLGAEPDPGQRGAAAARRRRRPRSRSRSSRSSWASTSPRCRATSTGWGARSPATSAARWSAASRSAGLLGERLPVTGELVGLAFVVSLVLAVPVALLAAHRPNGVFDRISMVVSIAGPVGRQLRARAAPGAGLRGEARLAPGHRLRPAVGGPGGRTCSAMVLPAAAIALAAVLLLHPVPPRRPGRPDAGGGLRRPPRGPRASGPGRCCCGTPSATRRSA